MKSAEAIALEIARKHCGHVSDYLGPDLEAQMGIYLSKDIAEAILADRKEMEAENKELRKQNELYNNLLGS